MPLTNLQVFSKTIELLAGETNAQAYDKFNAATRGALVLRAGNNAGDFTDLAKYQKIAGLIGERDAYGSDDVAAVDLARILEGSVKVGRRIGPVNTDPGWWDWIGRAPTEPGAVVAEQVSGDGMADRLNTAIAAFVAATLNVGATLVNDMGANTITLAGLADGAQKFGDRAQAILCWLMHSKTYTDLYKAALTNANDLFTFGDVKIVADPMGRPLIITDSADLIDGADYYTLGLTAGAIVVEDNPDLRVITEEKTGKENLRAVYQGQYSFNVGMKGFRWNQATGGASPSDAALAVGTNWTKTASSVKDMAGVIVVAH